MVLGAGPGGYAAAFYASDRGKKVVLIENDKRLGGVCLNRGCIPSKSLLHATYMISEAEASARRGIAFSKPEIDTARLRSWKDGIIHKPVAGTADAGPAARSGGDVRPRPFRGQEKPQGRNRRRPAFHRFRERDSRHRVGTRDSKSLGSGKFTNNDVERSARSGHHPSKAAGHWRGLHRNGTGHGVRGVGQQGHPSSKRSTPS